mgnify:CR=1 FL=1
MGQIFVLEDPRMGSNCYGIEEAGKVLLIDPNDGRKIINFMEQKGWEPQLILLTHEHCDHMYGLNEIREKYHPQVVATKACSDNLKNHVKNMSGLMGMYLHFRNGSNEDWRWQPILCEAAEITFQREYACIWQGHQIWMKALPGHTEGSCGIVIDQKYLFSGDYLIREEEVITGFPGGDADLYEKVSKPWLKEYGMQFHIYPGHGKDYAGNEARI